jgi:hypothetical protein
MAEMNGPMPGIELVQVHPDLQVAESNRLNGNLNPRFSDVEEVYESRMRLMGAAGCDQMVVMLPKGRDRYQDLEEGTVTAPKEAYDKWPEDLRPDADVVYDAEDPPRMIDLPFDGFITSQPGKCLPPPIARRQLFMTPDSGFWRWPIMAGKALILI